MHSSLLLDDVERVACGEDCMTLVRYLDHDCEKNSQSSSELFGRIARRWRKNNRLLIDYLTAPAYHIRSKALKGPHYPSGLVDPMDPSSIRVLEDPAGCGSPVVS